MRPAAALLALALAWPASLPALERISLFALFQDQAVLQLDDRRQRLRTGETSPEGVRLLSTDTRRELALVEVDGEPRELRLGLVYEAASPGPASLTLHADGNGFFHAAGSINGTPVTFLVDTGANIVALSGDLARRIGIDYRRGQAGTAMTAAGPVKMYAVRLDRIRIGDIQLYNVEAGIIEGAQPATPLLGMSFLSRLNMNQTGNRMELVQRY